MTYVDGNDYSSENCDPDANIQIRPPVSNNKARRSQIRWRSNNILEEVVPTSGEPDQYK
jgi:hypothetical protein